MEWVVIIKYNYRWHYKNFLGIHNHLMLFHWLVHQCQLKIHIFHQILPHYFLQTHLEFLVELKFLITPLDLISSSLALKLNDWDLASQGNGDIFLESSITSISISLFLLFIEYSFYPGLVCFLWTYCTDYILFFDYSCPHVSCEVATIGGGISWYIGNTISSRNT